MTAETRLRPLEGRAALVTGAARNVGRAIALRLAAEGARVVVNTRSDADAANSVVAEIEAAGGEAIVAVGDITDAQSVSSMVTDARNAVGPITIVVCNAAVRSSARIREIDIHEWDTTIRTTLYGAFYCVKTCLGDMTDEGFGRIIAISGDGPHQGMPGHAHVGAAKLGLEGLMRGLATELGPDGITVNTVSPGIVATTREFTSELHRERLQEQIATSLSGNPLGRAIEVDEIADLVTYLASPRARFVSGQTIHANGGGYHGY
ncbi:SDR family NAD(P)-dependent oxidoreductase [Rhodococcus artemisiae]|uniref:3-oxoacyl-[acyl-carrier-protein] reductase MabA n=1 Tax=Rhodococcus artemisiae TaxID=714159 RepID=A0ABU7LBT9_9NOCA|nr:SDR family oxidoreductase [Rhodococcus artemisiae]MEE2059015.1 SDR family oxidoreductase [Rhodococcus artemisiae]